MTYRRFRQIIHNWVFDNITLRFRLFKLKDWYHAVRRTPSKIKQVIRWLPVIYAFEPWDRYYLLCVWIKSLEEQRSFYKNRSKVMCAEAHRLKIIKTMSEMIIILNNLQDTSKYIEKEWDKMPKCKMESMPIVDKDGFITMYELKFKYKSKKLEQKQHRISKRLRKKELDMTEADLVRFGQIFKNNIFDWWD